MLNTLPLRRRILINGYKLLDLSVMIFAFGLATQVSYFENYTLSPSFEQFLAVQIKIENLVLILGFIVLWHGSFSAFKLYHTRRLSRRYDEIADIVKASTLGTLFLCLGRVVFSIDLVSPFFLAVFWGGSTSGLIAGRLVVRYVLGKIRRKGRNLRHVVIVGTNQRALHFLQQIKARPHLGYNFLGFIDDEWSGLPAFKLSGHKIIADLAGFAAFIRENVIDEVIIALPLGSNYTQADRIVALCQEQGIIVRTLGNIYNVRVQQTREENFGLGSLLTVYAGAIDNRQGFGKRLVDIVLSGFLIVLFLPLLLVVALLVKFDSPGPVFFAQERLGLNKRRFRLLKFRTMEENAESQLSRLEHLNEVNGPAFKMRHDPRVTRLGAYLRKSSIDELPQLFNILKGDMSLVGPRPLPERDYDGFDRDWYRRRFSVKPGLTCLWQVNGRSNIDFETWMQLDMQYIDEWSPWLDFKILMKTVPVVLRGTGAA